ncbi:MAG: general secretion pathway protein GspB [Proteobacteria bacterium]|nr:general secretion pathway protein GspB [Pseudomonadota bacterium]
MSFILDALKKSETDRQRQSGPALFEVKVAPRRVGLPSWAIALGVLLAINLVIVMWMLLRHPSAPAESPAATAVPAGAPAPARAAVPAAPAPAVAVQGAPPAGGAPQALAPPSVPTPVANAAQAQGLAPAAAAVPETSPEDLAPAAEPAPSMGSHVQRGTAEGVPLYTDAAVVPGTHIPALRLDLHVYAARPEDRFVMINMKKLREGDSLPEGVRVEAITPEGAVLSYSGSRFLLPNN